MLSLRYHHVLKISIRIFCSYFSFQILTSREFYSLKRVVLYHPYNILKFLYIWKDIFIDRCFIKLKIFFVTKKIFTIKTSLFLNSLTTWLSKIRNLIFSTLGFNINILNEKFYFLQYYILFQYIATHFWSEITTMKLQDLTNQEKIYSTVKEKKKTLAKFILITN